MSTQRPDPDALLARVHEEEARRVRGKLKVFFGAAAGVGKTYAMLEVARDQRAAGVDVVAGVVETHGRQETQALLDGLEILPRRAIEYRGVTLHEFDLDAAIARRPALILVDELAHTNAPGSRHAKRWQDVQELLDAGIDVYTTLNVQHLESLTDVVAKITGVVVRETVPDSVMETADEVEVVDLPAEDLRKRLREGKVYVPEQAAEAVRSFFREGNLTALRELALRHAADRVDAQMQRYRREHAIAPTWPVTERVLVCVGPTPLASQLVRAGRRLATTLGAEWVVAHVETPASVDLPDAARALLHDALRLAESLGAETVTLTGTRMSDEILAYAHSRNVSKIVIGKPVRPLWKRLLLGSIVDALVRGAGDIDIYVIAGDGVKPAPPTPRRPRFRRAPSKPLAWLAAVAVVIVCTAIAWVIAPHVELANIVMVYLLGNVLFSARTSRGPAALASLLSVVALDFFFVPPYFTFAVADPRYLITFAVMFVTSLVISSLTVRVLAEAESARKRERRTAAIYAMSREQASTRGIDALLEISVRHLVDVFGGRVVILMPDATRRLQQRAGALAPFYLDPNDLAVAQWAFEHGQPAGMSTENVPGAQMLFVPLPASRGVVGVIGMRLAAADVFDDPEQRHLLHTFANQIALAIERGLLAAEAHAAQITVETERLRNALLSSVSHDLRTPLASITGAASTLLANGERIEPGTRKELLETVHEEAERLNRLVQNLLEMTRLESGALTIKEEWCPIQEIVGAALHRFTTRLRDRRVVTNIPADLPLVPLDPVLVEQVVVNLIDNAVKYTPATSPLEISAAADDRREVTVEIGDHGPGLPPGSEQRVFEKFYRADGHSDRGSGLGLAICRAIVDAHKGRIWAENRPSGGVTFRFALPIHGTPPAIDDRDG